MNSRQQTLHAIWNDTHSPASKLSRLPGDRRWNWLLTSAHSDLEAVLLAEVLDGSLHVQLDESACELVLDHRQLPQGHDPQRLLRLHRRQSDNLQTPIDLRFSYVNAIQCRARLRPDFQPHVRLADAPVRTQPCRGSHNLIHALRPRGWFAEPYACTNASKITTRLASSRGTHQSAEAPRCSRSRWPP